MGQPVALRAGAAGAMDGGDEVEEQKDAATDVAPPPARSRRSLPAIEKLDFSYNQLAGPILKGFLGPTLRCASPPQNSTQHTRSHKTPRPGTLNLSSGVAQAPQLRAQLDRRDHPAGDCGLLPVGGARPVG